MNEPRDNTFDAANAARLCEASAEAYLEQCGDMSPLSQSTDMSAHSTDTHARITRTEDDIIIAFRGTADLRNWFTDLDCAFDMEDGCRIHRGFARAVDSVQDQISAEIFSPQREGRRLWLTGHSLGGALAMLYAWRFFNTYHLLPFAGIYTFGQPRVGDAAFRDVYNSCPELFCGTFRIVHANDIVPRVPWLLGAYRQAGHEIFFPMVGRGRTAEAVISPIVPIFAEPSNLNQGSTESHPTKAWLMDPSALAKLPWDVRNAWRELRREKLALLADHHVNTYLDLFQTDALDAAKRAEGFDLRRVRR